MAKKRLSEMAKEYGLTFDQAHEIASNNLDEEMITGKGKNLWISKEGQDCMESLIPMVTQHRGIVISQAPNPRFVFVKTQESVKKFKVLIPLALSGKMDSKVIYFEGDSLSGETKYTMIKPPMRR